jgi:hypothetical protein
VKRIKGFCQALRRDGDRIYIGTPLRPATPAEVASLRRALQTEENIGLYGARRLPEPRIARCDVPKPAEKAASPGAITRQTNPPTGDM